MKNILKLLAVFVFFIACVAVAEEEIYDPWEPYNRRVFEFNDVLDEYVAEPVARGYDYVMPDFAKKGITNFFRNLSYPKYVVRTGRSFSAPHPHRHYTFDEFIDKLYEDDKFRSVIENKLI